MPRTTSQAARKRAGSETRRKAPIRAPKELHALLRADDTAREAWEAMTPARREQWVRRVQEAASPESRARTLEKLIALLTGR